MGDCAKFLLAVEPDELLADYLADVVDGIRADLLEFVFRIALANVNKK